jgi:CHAT domain-containing protein
VPTTVVSQWRAHDGATAELMADFYRRVQAGTPKAQALRAAQLALRHSQEHRHPSRWGAFFLAGDWR